MSKAIKFHVRPKQLPAARGTRKGVRVCSLIQMRPHSKPEQTLTHLRKANWLQLPAAVENRQQTTLPNNQSAAPRASISDQFSRRRRQRLFAQEVAAKEHIIAARGGGHYLCSS